MSRWIRTKFTEPLDNEEVYYFVPNEGIFLGRFRNNGFHSNIYAFDINRVSYWMPLKAIDKYRLPLPPEYTLQNHIEEELQINNNFSFTYTTTQM